MDEYKEYTRLRDIVVKRNKRAVQAGLMVPVHFPTVKEIKAGYVTPYRAMEAVKSYYSSGSQVKAIRQTGLTPPVYSFPVMPKPTALTPDEKREKRRQQSREYRWRKSLKNSDAFNELEEFEQGRQLSYIKALSSLTRKWTEAGLDIGEYLSKLTPSQVQAMVEYIDYRFDQATYKKDYVIDEFIADFGYALKQGYSADQIIGDFETFLSKRDDLRKNSLSMEGITKDEFMKLWRTFSKRPESSLES